MKIGTHFTLSEMLESQTGRRLNVAEQFKPGQTVIANLKALTENILDPLREHYGKPIIISSGYRSPRVNSAIGGASSSQHLTGHAADIKAANPIENVNLFSLIKSLKLPYDQLIWEYGTRANPAWIHVSYSPRHRRQILYIPARLGAP